jgi:Uma2 family endonuclease
MRCLLAARSFSDILRLVSALPSLKGYISADEYLELEEMSPFRHELIDGVMYAMSGASDDHGTIESNLQVALKPRLRGRVCKVTGASIKLQVAEPRDGKSGFYYPDAMICCDPSDRGAKKGAGLRKRLSAIFEILSPSTRNLDSGRKRTDYLNLPSLDVYVRIEQSRPEVVLERRTATGWEMETVEGLDGVVSLPTVQVQLPLAEIYEDVVFST